MAQLIFTFILSSLICVSGFAADRLVVYLPKKEGQSLSVEMPRRMLRVSIQNRLSSLYKKIDWVEEFEAPFPEDHETSYTHTDVILAHHDRFADVAASQPVRWILGTHLNELLKAQKYTSLIDVPFETDSVYFGLFLSSWAQSYSQTKQIYSSTDAAYWQVFRAADLMGGHLGEWTASRPTIKSELGSWKVGGEFFGPQEASTKSASAKAYAHSDFEYFSIQTVAAAMIPGWNVQPEKIPSVSWLTKRSIGVAWGLMQSISTSPEDVSTQNPGTPIGLAEEGEEIIVDGDSLRYFFSPLSEVVGPEIDLALTDVQYALLKRVKEELEVRIFFKKNIELKLLDPAEAKNMALYAVSVPSNVRFSVAFDEDIFKVKVKQPWTKFVKFKIKIPYGIPDSVAFRGATVNLIDGVAEVRVGLLRNTATLVGKAQLVARKFDGVDVWSSVLSNLKWIFPLLLLVFLL